MRVKFEWERLYRSHRQGYGGSNAHRAKVFGGWVVSSDIYTDVINDGNERSISTSLTFVPDANHEWELEQ